MDDLKPAEGSPLDAPPDTAVVLRGVGRSFTETTLNTTPSQNRAQKTLARILAAGREVGLARGKAGLTLQVVADKAAVSLATVYRYFSTPDDLIRTLVRERQLAHFNRFRGELKTMPLASMADLAAVLAARIARNYLTNTGVSQALTRQLMRDYHHIAYDELWDLAGDVAGEARRRGLGEVDEAARARLAMAFAAAGAYVKMAALRSPERLREAETAARLTEMFLRALEEGPLPAACAVAQSQSSTAEYRASVKR